MVVVIPMKVNALLRKAYLGKVKENHIISNLTSDSRQCARNSVFISTNGSKEHIRDAVERGAKTIITGGCEEILPNINYIFVENVRKTLALLAKIFYNDISKKIKLIGITGTNGKTTTTALTGQIMADYFESTFIVGNIGTPYTLMAGRTKKTSVTTAEISSFQLETIHDFHPVISAVLNITPDHLDRHKTMECYINTKLSITRNQTEQDVCVLNYEDKVLRERSKELKCKIVFFSSKTKLENGIYMDKNRNIYLAENGKDTFLINTKEMKLVGIHNAENVMAAIAIAEAANIPDTVYLNTIRAFEAIEHRIEYVTEIDNVIYYNDSKGTNTDASRKALEAMERKTVLIAGGYDKNSEYDEWISAFGDKIKCLVLLGATKDKIAKTAENHGFTNIKKVGTLKEAVEVSAKEAESGEAVLLSPACASWDMFKSYEERGKLFKQYVKDLN